MESLDPRVNRLQLLSDPNTISKAPLDQFSTYEVFVQPREGKPFQHEGVVHAPDIELAFVLAKETFTRRFTCISLFVVDTRDVFVSAMTEGSQSVYDTISDDVLDESSGGEAYEIFHLLKRGKQHVHVGEVNATDGKDALLQSRRLLPAHSTAVFNVWAICQNKIRYTREDEKDLWNTLPEKKFRDATAYKGGDKLSAFLQKD